MNSTGIFILGVCVRSLRGLAERILFNPARNMTTDWLTQQVRAAMKEKKPAPSFSDRVATIALPEPRTVWIITFSFACSLPISLGLSCWNPNVYGLDSSKLQSIYETLWQVDAGISAVALPILLFVIELSKDQKQAAARSHEVLIRETGIFSITLIALLGTVRIGLDLAWFQKPGVFASDILVFMATVGLTLGAYYSTLRLLLSPTKMKAKAMKLMREKMSDSLDASIAIRLANSMLFKKLEELNVGYWPWGGDQKESDRYLIVLAPSVGT